MDRDLLIVICFVLFILTKAQNDNNTSIVNKSWFWPVLAICLALLVSISSTLIILVYIYYKKQKSNDDSNLSNSHTNSLTSERHHQHSRHIQGFRSPPPPYTTCERPENLFMTSSFPPSYESHTDENPPAIVNVPSTRIFNESSILTSPSIQTFQA